MVDHAPRPALSPLDARTAQRQWLAREALSFDDGENVSPHGLASGKVNKAASHALALVEAVMREDLNTAATGRSLVELGKALDASSDEMAATLCASIRECGCIWRLVKLLDHSETIVHRMATMILANTAALEVDPVGAASSKRMILEAGGFVKVLTKIFAEESTTIMYALGAVQNLCCADLRCIETLQRVGAEVRLLELSKSPDARIARYAQGCLTNVRLTLATTTDRKASVAAPVAPGPQEGFRNRIKP